MSSFQEECVFISYEETFFLLVMMKMNMGEKSVPTLVLRRVFFLSLSACYPHS